MELLDKKEGKGPHSEQNRNVKRSQRSHNCGARKGAAFQEDTQEQEGLSNHITENAKSPARNQGRGNRMQESGDFNRMHKKKVFISQKEQIQVEGFQNLAASDKSLTASLLDLSCTSSSSDTSFVYRPQIVRESPRKEVPSQTVPKSTREQQYEPTMKDLVRNQTATIDFPDPSPRSPQNTGTQPSVQQSPMLDVRKEKRATPKDIAIEPGKLLVVEISALKGERLKNVEGMFMGKQDPYLKVFLGGEVRTSSVCTNGGKAPDWKGQKLHPFTIDFESDEATIALQVECWDEDKKRDKLIGRGALEFKLTGGVYESIDEVLLKTEGTKGKDAGRVQVRVVATPSRQDKKAGASTLSITKERQTKNEIDGQARGNTAIIVSNKATPQGCCSLLEDTSTSALLLNSAALKVKCLRGKGLHKVAAMGFSQDPYLKLIVFAGATGKRMRSASATGHAAHT